MLDGIVQELLDKYTGGTEFFNQLDKRIQQPMIVHQILKMVKEKNIIVSGGFGWYFRHFVHMCRIHDLNVIIVEGGIRTGRPVTDLSKDEYLIRDRQFAFIDDSFYSGKTMLAIKRELERNGGVLSNVYVAYDGSHTKLDNVHSLYRYYGSMDHARI